MLLSEAKLLNHPTILYYVIYNTNAEEISSESDGIFLSRDTSYKGIYGTEAPSKRYKTQEDANRTLAEWTNWAQKKYNEVQKEIESPREKRRVYVPGKYFYQDKKNNPYVQDLKLLQGAKIGAIGLLPI